MCFCCQLTVLIYLDGSLEILYLSLEVLMLPGYIARDTTSLSKSAYMDIDFGDTISLPRSAYAALEILYLCPEVLMLIINIEILYLYSKTADVK